MTEACSEEYKMRAENVDQKRIRRESVGRDDLQSNRESDYSLVLDFPASSRGRRLREQKKAYIVEKRVGRRC